MNVLRTIAVASCVVLILIVEWNCVAVNEGMY